MPGGDGAPVNRSRNCEGAAGACATRSPEIATPREQTRWRGWGGAAAAAVGRSRISAFVCSENKSATSQTLVGDKAGQVSDERAASSGSFGARC